MNASSHAKALVTVFLDIMGQNAIIKIGGFDLEVKISTGMKFDWNIFKVCFPKIGDLLAKIIINSS